MHLGITEKPSGGGCISCVYILDILFKISEQIASENTKIAMVDNPSVIWCAVPKETCKCPHIAYISRN